MRLTRPARRFVVALPVALVALGAGLIALGLSTRPADAGSEDAGSSQVQVATSVCDAQRLKARQAEDPRLQIEIPKQFDTPWPTLSACQSYQAAQDPYTPGPLQPIPFSHKHHAGKFEIDCQYCHSGTDRSPSAGVPSVELCMGCHAQFPSTYDTEFEGIRVLKQHWDEKTPIEWEQIYRLPEHVQFRHNRHVRAGFDCQTCHGPVEEMDKIVMMEETHWWPWLLPTTSPEMGWCINCHRENDGPSDCYACHY